MTKNEALTRCRNALLFGCGEDEVAEIMAALSPAPLEPAGGEGGESDIADLLTPISKAEADAAWEQFIKEHVRPSKLLALAAHFRECKSCRDAFNGYMEDLAAPAPSEPAAEGERP